MKKITFSVAAFALIVGAGPALALQQAQPPSQQPPTTEPPRAEAPAPAAQDAPARSMKASGELVKVDTEAKTISIKGADGAEQLFSYNDQTEVTGGREGVAGLATKAGSQVTIEYKSDAGAKMATKIKVDDRAERKP